MLFQPENCPTILRENPGLLEKQRFPGRCVHVMTGKATAPTLRRFQHSIA
jgi:hypothetical protein